MKPHFKRWGAIYILTVMWLVSSLLQFNFQLPEIQQEGMATFWAATFENWQSEFLQLMVQGLLIVGAAKHLFTKAEEDKEELKAEIDKLRQQVLER